MLLTLKSNLFRQVFLIALRDVTSEVDVGKNFESNLNSRVEHFEHKHNPDLVDIIVCWEHNWLECPKQIEIIELSSLIGKIEDIAKEVKEPKRLSAYNEFCRDKRLEGLTFSEIATLWKKHLYTKTEKNQKAIENVLSDWQQFCRNKRLEGKTFSEIGKLWQKQRSKRDTHGD